MSARGLGSTMRRPLAAAARGTSLEPQLSALSTAVAEGRGRLDDALLDEVQALVERATSRLRLSAQHTVVAIAGATGSGKSTTFNALAGAEISASSAQRPTTAAAKALVWSNDDAGDLLDWLGIPGSARTAREDVAEKARWGRLPDGLVLLDLPDHDSVEVAHHDEARRVVALADVLIWVVDPQKYADAAIHREFLQPLAGHRDVTMIVLNHIDTVPEDRREWMLRDVRKVVAADGMKDARILGISARQGIGVDELRTALRRRVEEKRNAMLRVDADLRAAARRLSAAAGEGPTLIPDVWVTDLQRRVMEAAGVPTVVARAERLDAERRRAALWMPWRGARAGSYAEAADLRVGAVDRPAVDTAVRSFADQVAEDLAPGWAAPIRAAASSALAATDERLDGDLAAQRIDLPTATGLGGFRGGQALAALLGFVAVGAFATGRTTTGLVLSTAAAVLLAVLAGVGPRLAARGAHQHALVVEKSLRGAVARVVQGQVVDPLRPVVVSYGRFRTALDQAVEERPTRG